MNVPFDEIEGVGEATAENLAAAGFVTLDDLTAENAAAIAEVDGVGLNVAVSILTAKLQIQS